MQDVSEELENAERCGVVAIDPMGSFGVQLFGRHYVARIVRLLRARGHKRSPVATHALLQWLFVLRDDEEFLRHVKWRFGASESVEQGWSRTLYVFLALDAGSGWLFEFGRAPVCSTTNVFDVKKLRTKRRLAASTALTLALLVGSSCLGGDSSLMRLVPIESCAILILNWSSIRADGELRRVLKGDEFEALLQRLGIESESIKTVTVFSAINSQSSSGLLLRGSFDRKAVVAELKDNGWSEASIEGHKVYVNAADYIAILSSNTLFAGTREGAVGVFRAADDSKESILASEAYKRINDALSTKAQPVKAFLLIPQGTLDMADAALTATSIALSFFNLGGVGQLLRAVNVAKGFAFSVASGKQEKYPVELCVLLRDEDTAALVNGSLNAMKAVSELAASDTRDQESVRALRQMTIVRKHEVLAVKMEIPGRALFPPN